MRNSEEILSLVSTGEAVSLLPRHINRYWVRPDVVYLPVQDTDLMTFALVWSTEAENDLIRTLARAVRDLGLLDLLGLLGP